MSNSFFRFKQFTIHQEHCAMKVTTDACLFGAWAAQDISELKPRPNQILDIGTGTGLLSLMLAQKTNTPITAVELDPPAAQQARQNFDNSSWKKNLTVLESDARDLDQQLKEKFDVIVSNPPFYEKELVAKSAKKNMAHHHKGLLFSDMLSLISLHLSANGRFYLLLPQKRFNELMRLFEKSNLSVSKVVLIKQTPDHENFRFFICGSHSNTPTQINSAREIIIRNEEQEYSSEFILLLKDYYFNL